MIRQPADFDGYLERTGPPRMRNKISDANGSPPPRVPEEIIRLASGSPV
jgi:hypothetical protein